MRHHDMTRLFRVLEFLMITLATSLESALRGQPFDYFVAGYRASLFYTQLHTRTNQIAWPRCFRPSQLATLTVRQVDARKLTKQRRQRPDLLRRNQLDSFLGNGLHRDKRVLQQLLAGFGQ